VNGWVACWFTQAEESDSRLSGQIKETKPKTQERIERIERIKRIVPLRATIGPLAPGATNPSLVSDRSVLIRPIRSIRF